MNYINGFIEPYGEFIINSEILLSAKTFNKLGNQYLSGIYLINNHNHNDIYYTKEEMNIRYFSDTFNTNSDADMIDGYHLEDILGESLPIESIILWESETPPIGWAICNGQKVNDVVTIDMRDYFTAIAGENYSFISTFGTNLFSLSVKNFNISEHILTIDEIPSHRHAYIDQKYYTRAQNSYEFWYPNTTGEVDENIYTGYTGGDKNGNTLPHNHNIGSTLTLDNNLLNADNRPLYYALYFIEKVI